MFGGRVFLFHGHEKKRNISRIITFFNDFMKLNFFFFYEKFGHQNFFRWSFFFLHGHGKKVSDFFLKIRPPKLFCGQKKFRKCSAKNRILHGTDNEKTRPPAKFANFQQKKWWPSFPFGGRVEKNIFKKSNFPTFPSIFRAKKLKIANFRYGRTEHRCEQAIFGVDFFLN